MSSLDQSPDVFGAFDIAAYPELWDDFVQIILDVTLEVYHMLKQEREAGFHWQEDTFTINVRRCMKKIIPLRGLPFEAETKQHIFTDEMMSGDEATNKAVELDIKMWHQQADDDIYFAWECKLIVDKAREDKHKRLAEEYITKGIIRFLNGHWKYAESVQDAGMLGYVLYGEIDKIVAAINREMLAISQRPASHTNDVRVQQALASARNLSSSDMLALNQSSFINNHLVYESCHHRPFCNRNIHLDHLFLTFDFAA